MATKVVKTLKFPNSTDEYQINAVRLNGKTPDELIQTLTVADKSNTDTTDLVYAVTNIVEGGTKGHTLTPTYTGLPTKSYVDGVKPLMVTLHRIGNDAVNFSETFDTILAQSEERPVIVFDLSTSNVLTLSKVSANDYIIFTCVQGPTQSVAVLYKDNTATYEELTLSYAGDLVGFVPTLRKINGHDLTSDVTLTPADLGLEQAMKFIGTSSTYISDGSTTSTITVNSKSVNVTAGNVVLYDGYEYVWTGSSWEQLGQEGSFSLKTHTHTVTHTPGGDISAPTFTGTPTLIKGTFNGTEQTASVSYTPAGAVSAPTITVTPNTTTVNSITGVGSLPTLEYSNVAASRITAWSAGRGSFTASTSSTDSTVPNKVVTLSHTHTAPSLTYTADVNASQISKWSTGTLPSKGSNTTVVTSIKSATATQPTFTGTAATISHKHTPAGTVTITTAAPGTGETANYTPAGTVTKPIFTGTRATLTTSAANS